MSIEERRAIRAELAELDEALATARERKKTAIRELHTYELELYGHLEPRYPPTPDSVLGRLARCQLGSIRRDDTRPSKEEQALARRAEVLKGAILAWRYEKRAENPEIERLEHRIGRLNVRLGQVGPFPDHYFDVRTGKMAVVDD